MFSSYHMEQKTFIDKTFTNNIHAEKRALKLLLLKVCGSFFFRQSKKWWTSRGRKTK